MPASGYELGMGEFVLPSLGIFLIGWLLIVAAGYLFDESRVARRRRRDTVTDPHRKYLEVDPHLMKKLMR